MTQTLTDFLVAIEGGPLILSQLRMPFRHMAIGSGTGIRTPIHGFKVRCPAVGRYPNDYGMYVYIGLLLGFNLLLLKKRSEASLGFTARLAFF
jgi:hypothetical protein